MLSRIRRRLRLLLIGDLEGRVVQLEIFARAMNMEREFKKDKR